MTPGPPRPNREGRGGWVLSVLFLAWSAAGIAARSPAPGDPPRGRPTTPEGRILLGERIDLNRAPLGDLLAVPGLSEGRARSIVADRARRGRFARPSDLLRVRGVGPKTLDRIAPYVEVR